jgi:hypothetical protein
VRDRFGCEARMNLHSRQSTPNALLWLTGWNSGGAVRSCSCPLHVKSQSREVFLLCDQNSVFAKFSVRNWLVLLNTAQQKTRIEALH